MARPPQRTRQHPAHMFMVNDRASRLQRNRVTKGTGGEHYRPGGYGDRQAAWRERRSLNAKVDALATEEEDSLPFSSQPICRSPSNKRSDRTEIPMVWIMTGSLKYQRRLKRSGAWQS